MGISPGWFNFFLDLCRSGDIKPGSRILDIGASELFCADEPGVLNNFLGFFGAKPYPGDELLRVADRSFAGPLFERAGFRYAAIDYANFPGIIRIDLNVGGLPAEHKGRYHFVANSGTSEHILNQYNVFKVIHEAAAEGAIMYHGVPGWGEYEHGLIGYSPKFFWCLAKDNNYELLRFWGWADGDVQPLKPAFMKDIAFPHAPKCEKVSLHVIMRKLKEGPFRGLNDPAFSPDVTVPQR
jgi:hypothetical protein